MNETWGVFAAGFVCCFSTLFIGVSMIWWGLSAWAARYSIAKAQAEFDSAKMEFDFETARQEREQRWRQREELHRVEIMKIRIDAGLPPEGK